MANKRTGEEMNADFIKLSEILTGIAKLEKDPIEQFQYIGKELPGFIEEVWQKGYAEGLADGENSAKTKPFNFN